MKFKDMIVNLNNDGSAIIMEEVLDKIALLIEREQKNDWWNEISDAEKASI
jgi:hypothetical protein